MKQLILLAVVAGLNMSLFAQETAEKIMEKRAREMHRVIGLDDKQQWKAFVSENYTQALIDRPMRMKVETSDSGTASNQAQTIDKLDAKATMFEQLHTDFGKSKLVSIKPSGEQIEMVLKNDDGLQGVFTLKFSKSKPYLIDALGIEVQDDRQ
jgi:hypothetical protein